MSRTLYDKIWDDHVIREEADGTSLLYIDRHLLHEVTSAQAFEGLQLTGRAPWRTSSMIATPDHNVPTIDRNKGIADTVSALQVATLADNCRRHRIRLFDMRDRRQGIVHVVGPEQGASLPGATLVCGDSHTSTHGAFAALAFGIGTSEVEHVLATQCLIARKSRNMLVQVEGDLPAGCSAKDLVLHVIGIIGTAGGTGCTIEFAGSTIRALSMEGRMTVCNMAIEAGARAGLVAVDETTIEYLKDRPYAPTGEAWEQAVTEWRALHSDADARFERVVEIDASTVRPQVTWGTSPDMVVAVDGTVPDPMDEADPVRRDAMMRALVYMGLAPRMRVIDIPVDKIFIGSCTNGRIEDLRAAARILQGRRIAKSIKQALVVPGSGLVKERAEQEGLHEVFRSAGFEWREPGCSMCVGMNDDRLMAGDRCASTSNRNFEGRQGAGGRTHLVSPELAAAAAVAGRFIDPRDMDA